MKTVLIDGCSGFLGKNLIKILIEKKIKIILLTRDIKKLKKIFPKKNIMFFDYKKRSLNNLFKENIFCYVHLATCYGKQNQMRKYIFSVNYHKPLKILNKLLDNNLKYFINSDTYFSKNLKLKGSRKYYLLSKKKLLTKALEKKKLKVINLKIFQMYGPNDRKDKFLSKVIQSLKNGGVLNLTSGNQILDFVHVHDVAMAYYLILKKIINEKKINNTYEIGTSKGITLKNALLILKKNIISKASLNFGKIPNRKGERNKVANIKNIKLIGWRPTKLFKAEAKNLVK